MSCARQATAPKKEHHYKWKGGTSERVFAVRKIIKNIVKERGVCEECGSIEELQGHHKNAHSTHESDRANPDNIQVLCKVCHSVKHPKLTMFILSGGKVK